MIHEDHQVGYGDLWNGILHAAGRLRREGIRRGDRVVLSAARAPEFVYGYFASHLLGAIAVPVDPELPLERLISLVAHVRPGVMCVTAPLNGQPAPERVLPLRDLCRPDLEVDAAESEYPSPESHADLLLTSGTMGEPKGVLLTHRNILAAAGNINEFVGNTASDREAIALPLHHSFGLGRLRCQMLAGGTAILAAGFMFPRKLFRAMSQWEATGFSFVPAAWAMLTRLTKDELSSFSPHLRYIEIGSAPMPIEEKQRLMRLFPRTRICMHYGLTEASRSAFIEFHESADRLDSIGRPSPNVRVLVAGPDGSELPPGHEGSILIAGDHVSPGYWNPVDELPAPAGWLRSGDIGYRTEEGYLYLRGREDELINVGGRKVYPSEIEIELKRHEGVGDCICIGVRDPQGITGERVQAFLEVAEGSAVRPSPQELSEFLSGKLDSYKIPIAFQWVETLPRNSSGKPNRGMLRELAMGPAVEGARDE